MGWARLDDGMHDHPKLIGLSLEALGLWTKCLTWAHRHHGGSLVLGHIPDGLPATFDSRRGKRLAAELVEHRLWDVEPELGGWTIHDYIDFLPAAEKPESASEVSKARSEAGKRGAEARWKATQEQADSKLPSAGQSESMPPTRPDQNQTNTTPATQSSSPRKRATRLPEPFIVDTEMRRWAAGEVPGLDVDRSTRAFVDYWRAKAGQGGTKVDWTATWRNWLRTDHDRTSTAPAGRGTPARPSKDDRALETLRMGAEVQAALEARNQPSDTTFALREIPA